MYVTIYTAAIDSLNKGYPYSIVTSISVRMLMTLYVLDLFDDPGAPY